MLEKIRSPLTIRVGMWDSLHTIPQNSGPVYAGYGYRELV